MEKLNKYYQLLPKEYADISVSFKNKKKAECSEKLFDIISKHKIVHFLIENQLLEISQSVQEYLKKSVSRNFANIKEVIDIDTLLIKKNIDVIHLKGISLSKILYDDISFRSIGDIDIFIKSKDLKKTTLILKSNFYKNIELKNTFWSLSFYKYFYYHFMFKKLDSNQLIEVHWGLSRDNFINKKYYPEIWQKAKKIDIAGYNFLTLDDEWNYIFLLVHGAIHSWYKLLWLSDLYTIVEKWTLNDWDYYENKCRVLNIERPFYASIFLMAIFFELKYPEKYNIELIDKKIDKIIKFSINSVVTDNYKESRLNKLIYLMMLKKGFLHKFNTLKYRIIRIILRFGI
ncbi:MAG: hypothetical protein A2046_14495 [Bacteroidetes bacterium GWA2_30_7]|nr:MAG: hypothetical protein A2046_14495 [Bacteroidetes bacterium GWA2_30_7]